MRKLMRNTALSGSHTQRRKGIFLRTFVMITVLCIVLIVLPTAIFIPMARSGWLNGLESQARSLSASIAEVSGNAFVTGDYSFIVDHNTQVMRGSRDIRYVIIVKNDGSSLIHTGTAWEQKEKPDPKWRLKRGVNGAGQVIYNDLVNEEVYHYSFPLQISGIDWGVLYLGLSLKDFHAQVGRILPAAIAFSLPALALALLVAFLIARRITSPILVLRSTADRIIQGDMTARADINSGDEVQDLAGSFNRMTDTILKSQDDIASARDYIENILRSLAECLVVFKTDKTIELVNRATIELLGYEENELIGKSIDVLFDQYDGFLEPGETGRAAAKGITSNLEKHFLTKNGRKFPVLFSYAPLQGRDGAISGLVGIALDITEQKTAQTLLEKSREEAVAANKAKSEFLANMSHEIRTPMNGILGMLDMLIHSHLDKEQKRFADTAYGSANILLSILNDILDLSKIEAGKMELETIDFDIRDGLKDVAHLFSARINTKLLNLRIAVDDQLTTAVKGDPVRFRQIITNLVGNAVKFTDAGEIVVRARRLEQDDEIIFLRFEVSDTGVGIDDVAKRKIFDSFTQADASTTRKHGGTGLGLSISRGRNHRRGKRAGEGVYVLVYRTVQAIICKTGKKESSRVQKRKRQRLGRYCSIRNRRGAPENPRDTIRAAHSSRRG
jgi:PAS domain S-box-containing protein